MTISRILGTITILAATAACNSIESPVETRDDDVEQVPYAEQTNPFGFQISVPGDLAEAGWAVKDPLFLAGQSRDGFQQLVIRRVFGAQVDAPPGGEHLLNVTGEFGANQKTTRLVIFVYEREDLTLDAVADSVRGVAYDAFDDRVSGLNAKQIVFKGLQQRPGRPRNASESLIPQLIVESNQYFYFILYWETDPEALRNVLKVLDTLTIFTPTG
jgi:hypothetical protein